jgi:hypothetical protein
MKALTKKRKMEIIDAIIEDTEFADAFKRHRVAIRKMMLEAIDAALTEADDSQAEKGQ